jgi:hypothetical protein
MLSGFLFDVFKKKKNRFYKFNSFLGKYNFKMYLFNEEPSIKLNLDAEYYNILKIKKTKIFSDNNDFFLGFIFILGTNSVFDFLHLFKKLKSVHKNLELFVTSHYNIFLENKFLYLFRGFINFNTEKLFSIFEQILNTFKCLMYCFYFFFIMMITFKIQKPFII